MVIMFSLLCLGGRNSNNRNSRSLPSHSMTNKLFGKQDKEKSKAVNNRKSGKSVSGFGRSLRKSTSVKDRIAQIAKQGKDAYKTLYRSAKVIYLYATQSYV
jgi:hypothetical protein